MALEIKLVAAGELPTTARAFYRQSGKCFLFHPNLARAAIVREDLLDIGSPITAAGLHAVKTLRIAAGEIVQLQMLVAAYLKRVINGPHRHGLAQVGFLSV